jgi:hypothetical protein
VVRRLAPNLLGRHVAHGAQDRAGGGLVLGRLQGRVGAAAKTRLLHEAEIEQLHASLARDEDVLRFQVAVDDAFLVGCGQPLGHLHGELDRLACGKRAVLEPLAQRLPFEELHDGVRGGAVPPEVVDGKDVRMRELGDRARLALEACERLGVVGQLGGEDLDRDVAIEFRVARLVDLAHAAGPERGEDFVRAEARAVRQNHQAISLFIIYLFTSFNSAGQLTMTVSGCEAPCSGVARTRKRRPSRVASYGL